MLSPISGTNNVKTLEEENIYDSYDVINAIEEELSQKNTSVINELVKVYDYYRIVATNAETDDDKRKALDLMDTLSKQISHYELVSQTIHTQSNPENIFTADYCKAAVAAITAWFNFKGYYLSAELLQFSYKNKSIHSVYSPIGGRKVKESFIYSKIINSTATTGSDSFPNSGSTVEKDLYYSIHSFSWSKQGAYLKINDIYDYAPASYAEASVQNAAVNSMYYAQQLGIITPYTVQINIQYK